MHRRADRLFWGRILQFATLFLVWIWAPVTQAQNDDALTLYLPVLENDRPQMFTALDRRLQSAISSPLNLRGIDYWHGFQHGLRSGRKGLYFAPPHFAAWAIAEHDFTPLVRLSGTLRYVIAADRSNPQLFEINDLANRPICTTKPLNLDYLLTPTCAC